MKQKPSSVFWDVNPKKLDYEPYHLVLGLTYFKDADKEPMPNMLCQVKWQEVKKFFQNQARGLIKI